MGLQPGKRTGLGLYIILLLLYVADHNLVSSPAPFHACGGAGARD